MRVGGALYFLHGDHLGSATLTTDASGNRIGELRYTPYGVTRYEWGNTPTNRRYTGQRWEGFGLYDYGARMYSPSWARFVSADVFVPDPPNPQSLNRYAYVLNNPLRYTDPTGHIEIDETARAQEILNLLAAYGVVVRRDWGWRTGVRYDELGEPHPVRYWERGAWTLNELELLRQAIEDLGSRVGGAAKVRELIGPAYVRRVHGKDLHRWFCENIYPRVVPAALTTWRTVRLYDETFLSPQTTIVHELAHVWDWGSWASESLEDFVGDARPTVYAQTNPEEHWAETVTGWIYPDYPEFGLSPRHRQYVALAVNAQIPIPWWAEPPNLSIEGGSWP
jgi:RHS repeat-associated protein